MSLVDEEAQSSPQSEGTEKCRRLYPPSSLRRTVNLRNTPEIRFILDESIEYGVNMSRLIDDVIERDHSKGTESEDGEKQDAAETEDEE